MNEDIGKQLDRRIDQIDRQVRHEADLRIVALMLEYRKRAEELLSPEEMVVCTGNLGVLLANPEIQLPAGVMDVFRKLDGDPVEKDLFARLQTLAQAKILTRKEEPAPRGQPLNALLRGSGYVEVRPPGDSYSTRSKGA